MNQSFFTRALSGAAAAFTLAAASPALAQDAPVEEGGDTFTIGAGAAYLPTYEGSDDYRLIPAAAARGKVSGFNFYTRGLQLYVDLIPEPVGESVDFSLGAVAGLRMNRTGKDLKDAQVEALGRLETGYEVGAFAGIAKTGVLTSAYDTISFRVAYVKDVGDAHESHVITPAIEYGTPLSTSTYVGIGASADFVGDGYASYYYRVSPAGAAASGLPVFGATDGGFKSWSTNILAVQSLSGDLRGGLALFAVGSYTRLQDRFAASPIVSVAGDRDQWVGAIGLGYTF